MVEGRPMEPLEGPLWRDFSISDVLVKTQHPDGYRQRNFQQNLYNTGKIKKIQLKF